MPKSKRDKKISLTKTNKKGLALKQKIIDDLRSCVEKYKSIYVFSYKNMRNEKMQEARVEWKPSRFFFGKNRVLGVGLGRKKEEEIEEDLHKISESLKGQCGMLFTDCTEKEVVDWFESYSYEGFARSGFKATQRIELKEGPLKQFSHAIEPYLRQLGMPTKLEKGVVTLIKDYEVCKKGTILTPEQAKILELMEYRLAEFKLNLRCCWIKGEGFKLLASEEDEDEEVDDNEDEENGEDVEMDDDEEKES